MRYGERRCMTGDAKHILSTYHRHKEKSMSDTPTPWDALTRTLPQELAQLVELAAKQANLEPLEYVSRVLQKAVNQALPHACGGGKDENAVYLSAPVTALVEGLYRQSHTLQELRRWGDFGLGTFNDLDGEMLLLDGRFHQMPANGQVCPVPDEKLESTRTPFACVTFFRPDTTDHITTEMDRQDIFTFLDSILPSRNMLYAIRVEGRFTSVRVRSVPRQQGQDERPLVEVAKNQPEFSFENILGSMAGFYTPPMMQGLNVPGTHLHFIDATNTKGGHLLECLVAEAAVAVQHVPRLIAGLPLSLDFMTADLSRDIRDDLDKVER